jgi:dipeptidyl aminopeptidase/acylaminoacyl peptidase
MKGRLFVLGIAVVIALSAVSGCDVERGATAFVASVKGTNARVVVTARRPSPDVLLLGEMGRFLNLSQHDQLWSDNGKFVYIEGKNRDPVIWLSIVTMAGDQHRLLDVEHLDLLSLSISRDGRRVLISYRASRVVETPFQDGTRQDTVRFSVIESVEVATGATRQLASVDNMVVTRASYSPDRRHVAFVGRTDDPFTHYNIYVMNAHGSDMRRLTDLNSEMNPFEPPLWSPDCRRILYSIETLFIDDITHFDDIFVVDTATGISMNLTNSPNADDGQYGWSPNGRKVAFYESDASGVGAVYVMNADGTNRRKVIGNAGAPSWADDHHILVSGVAYDEATGRWFGSGILSVDLTTRQIEILVPLQDAYGSLSSPLLICR